MQRLRISILIQPAPSVFPRLLKLSNSHMRTLKRDKKGWAVNLDKKLEDILCRLKESLPNTLSLEEQGVFILGYYHQYQKRFEKKQEDK